MTTARPPPYIPCSQMFHVKQLRKGLLSMKYVIVTVVDGVPSTVNNRSFDKHYDAFQFVKSLIASGVYDNVYIKPLRSRYETDCLPAFEDIADEVAWGF